VPEELQPGTDMKSDSLFTQQQSPEEMRKAIILEIFRGEFDSGHQTHFVRKISGLTNNAGTTKRIAR